MISVAKPPPQCILDDNVLNADTILLLTDIGISFFAPLCGRNRGVFVLHPTDDQTYGCLSFPPNFAELAGANDTAVIFPDANSIKNEYVAGNISSSDAVIVLDYFLQNVYLSSSSVDKDVYACEMGGLAKLECPMTSTSSKANKPFPVFPIRSVTMAGVFTPASYVTGSNKVLPFTKVKEFYTLKDFQEMVKLGLNTVQIPFPLVIFEHSNTKGYILNYLTDVLDMIKSVGLYAILELVGPDNDDSVTAATRYAANHTAIMALTIPSIQSLGAARAAEINMKLFVPVNQGDLKDLIFPDDNIYAAIDLTHTTDIADIASSNGLDDRMKLFYHESKACILRSPLEYTACYRNVQVFVSNGFDISIDNCINEYSNNHTLFVNYGQCNRYNETLESNWWNKHRISFANRQMFSYEQGLGWSYSSWKLYNNTTNNIDHPAQLKAFKNVANVGLITIGSSDSHNNNLACLNPPLSDFVLGDNTLSPTPGPPPDCGFGWWNASIDACSYWIPPIPPPTNIPSFTPTHEPIICPEAITTKSQLTSGVYGAIIALILSFIISKIMNRRHGYTRI